eukprot:973509-Prorocentrum_lima.AAC.1
MALRLLELDHNEAEVLQLIRDGTPPAHHLAGPPACIGPLPWPFPPVSSLPSLPSPPPRVW